MFSLYNQNIDTELIMSKIISFGFYFKAISKTHLPF
jgi:hypothetical protein